jgi:hypothetical protein
MTVGAMVIGPRKLQTKAYFCKFGILLALALFAGGAYMNLSDNVGEGFCSNIKPFHLNKIAYRVKIPQMPLKPSTICILDAPIKAP